MDIGGLMKKKILSALLLILVFAILFAHLYIGHDKEKKSFEELQVGISYTAETCEKYLISRTIEDSSDFQLQMIKAYGRLSKGIYDLIEDNKYIDSEYRFMMYEWIEELDTIYSPNLSVEKLNRESERISIYLNSIKEMSQSFDNTDMDIDEFISAQKTLIKSYSINLKEIKTNNLNKTLKLHPDYLSFKSKKADEAYLREALYEYLLLFYDDVSISDIKSKRKSDYAYPGGYVECMSFDYHDLNITLYPDGSVFDVAFDVNEKDDAVFSEEDEIYILDQVTNYLSTINQTEYDIYEIDQFRGFFAVTAFRSNDKRSNMDEFKFFFVKNNQVELKKVNYPWQIVKDIYDFADYEEYFEKKVLFDKKLENFDVSNAYFFISTSYDELDYFWKYNVFLNGKNYNITFDAVDGTLVSMRELEK